MFGMMLFFWKVIMSWTWGLWIILHYVYATYFAWWNDWISIGTGFFFCFCWTNYKWYLASCFCSVHLHIFLLYYANVRNIVEGPTCNALINMTNIVYHVVRDEPSYLQTSLLLLMYSSLCVLGSPGVKPTFHCSNIITFYIYHNKVYT